MMRQWWQTFNPRERMLISGAALLLLLLFAYLAIWQPWQHKLSSLRQTVTEQREQLAWMRQAAVEIKRWQAASAGARGKPSDSVVSLPTLLEQSARQAGLAGALKRVEPQAEGRFNVRLEDVEFEGVLRWLYTLYQQHGVVVADAVFNRQSKAGYVDVRLTVQQTAV